MSLRNRCRCVSRPIEGHNIGKSGPSVFYLHAHTALAAVMWFQLFPNHPFLSIFPLLLFLNRTSPFDISSRPPFPAPCLLVHLPTCLPPCLAGCLFLSFSRLSSLSFLLVHTHIHARARALALLFLFLISFMSVVEIDKPGDVARKIRLISNSFILAI